MSRKLFTELPSLGIPDILLPHNAVVMEPALALRNVAKHILIEVCEKLSGAELCPWIRLVIFRFELLQIFLRCAELLWWDITLRAAHLATVLLGALPDSIQLLLFQRRYTFGCFCIEVCLCFCFTVALNELACFFVQCSIASACQNEQLVHGLLTLKVHDLRILHSEQEAACVQCICVKFRKLFLNLLFQCYILFCAAEPSDRKVTVELRARCFAFFLLHVVSAEAHCKCYTGECFLYILWAFPIVWIVAVIVVTVHGDAVGILEIRNASYVTRVLCAHMIAAHCLLQRSQIVHRHLVGVHLILLRAGGFCCVDCK